LGYTRAPQGSTRISFNFQLGDTIRKDALHYKLVLMSSFLQLKLSRVATPVDISGTKFEKTLYI